jgi:hypothetical protein
VKIVRTASASSGPFYVGETRNEPGKWLHMEIEVPKCALPPSQAALQVRPKQLYGVNRETIASVLLTTDALPGKAEEAALAWAAQQTIAG